MTYDQAHFRNGERLSNFAELIQKSQDSKLGSLSTSKTKLLWEALTKTLAYRARSKSDRATERNPDSKHKTNKLSQDNQIFLLNFNYSTYIVNKDKQMDIQMIILSCQLSKLLNVGNYIFVSLAY